MKNYKTITVLAIILMVLFSIVLFRIWNPEKVQRELPHSIDLSTELLETGMDNVKDSIAYENNTF